MDFVDVIKCCLDSIRQISEQIEGAFVYLDAGSTESFQFLGAFPLLLELGARSVCSLENMSSLDMEVDGNLTSDPAGKVIIITSRFLSDAHRYVLRCLSTHQAVRHCSIFTSISEMAHSAYPDSPLGPDAYHEYETLLVQDYEEVIKRSQMNFKIYENINSGENLNPQDEGWSQFTSVEKDVSRIDAVGSARDIYKRNSVGLAVDVGQNLVVSVQHFPLIFCPFSPRVFVLPSEGSVAEAYLSTQHENSISAGLPPLGSGTPADGEDIPPGATLTAQFLYHMATKMDLKLEIFSVGDLSKTVGKLLTDMSSLYDVGRRKKLAGLLLIDRTVDLLTPCCHGDSLVDRIFSSLPRRKRISFTHMKGSQTQLNGPASLRRAPLDVQIPLDNILSKEDSRTENFRLVEGIEAFLHGWNSSDSTSQIVDLISLGEKPTVGEALHYKSELLNGSFVSTDIFRGTPYLEALLDRRTKDGAILIKKWLQETLRRENISLNAKIRPGFVSKSELETIIKAVAKSQSCLMRNKGIIQLATAALYALDELHSARWDAFSSAEKILNVSSGDTSQSLAAQINDIINKSALVKSDGLKNQKSELSPGLLTFQDAMFLTITGYILAGENFPTSGSGGPFSWQEEHFLKGAIVDVVLENPAVTRLKFLQDLTEKLEANANKKKTELKEPPGSELQSDYFEDDQWGSWDDEDTDKNINKEQAYDDMQLKLELRDRVDNFFKFLHKLSKFRQNILSKEGTMALERNFNDDSYSNKGLLYKLLTRVLNKNDVPGLQYHSSTVGRFLKSGFGRFGLGQATPSLADQSIILIFIIGGINGVEVREAEEALSETGRPDIQLILGGTTFLTPNDMFDLVLGEYSYL